MDWNHKEEWSKTGTNFTVVVSRHESYEDEYTGKYRWCVYAYIYPKHPHFKKFESDDLFQEATRKMPCHDGPSLLRYHYDKSNEITSIQVGADYHHLHDDCFTFHYTKEEASTVFFNAEELFEWLENYDR